MRGFVTEVVHGSEVVQLSLLGKMGPRPADAFSSTNPTSAVGAGSQDLLVLELQNSGSSSLSTHSRRMITAGTWLAPGHVASKLSALIFFVPQSILV